MASFPDVPGKRLRESEGYAVYFWYNHGGETMRPEEKREIIEKFRIHESDTGSTPVQIALLTRRIQELTEHLKIHRHDKHSRRGLMKMVGKRKRLLAYLARTDRETYWKLLSQLGLRK